MIRQCGPWLSLLTFCAVTTLAAALGMGALLAGASLAFAGAQASPVSDEAPTAADRQSLQVPEDERTAASAPQLPSEGKTSDDGGGFSRSFAGMITDSRCGARHFRNSGKSSAECVRSCVRNGASYILVDGETIYTLEGNPAQLDKLAGERAHVKGMLEGDTIRVKSAALR